MWNWYDSSYEDFEDLGGLAHHHHVVHDPMQPPHDYGLDGKSFFWTRNTRYRESTQFNKNNHYIKQAQAVGTCCSYGDCLTLAGFRH